MPPNELSKMFDMLIGLAGENYYTNVCKHHTTLMVKIE